MTLTPWTLHRPPVDPQIGCVTSLIFMNPGGQPSHLEHPIHLDHPGHLDHLELLLACLGRNLSFLLLYYSFVFQQIPSLLSTDHLLAPQIRVLSLGCRLRN